MRVVNLGNFGQRQESDLSGLPEALGRGLQAGAEIKRNQLAGQELQQRAKQGAAENRLQRSKYQMELAKLNAEQQKQGIDMGMKVVEQMSSRALSMDPSMRGVWEQSPEYKQLTKVVKKYAPDFIGEDGKVTLMGKEDLIKGEMDRRANQIEQKIVAGGIESLSPGEKDFITYKKNVGSEALAKVYAAVQDDDRFLDAQDAGDTATMAQIVQEYVATIFPEQGGLKGALKRPAVDPNDPLGLMQR